MKEVKIVNGHGMYVIAHRNFVVCKKNQNALWDLEFVSPITSYSKTFYKNEKDLENINKYVAYYGIEFVEETREKEKSTDKIDINQLCERIDFANDLFKDFTGRIDKYAKENKIPPELILDVVEAVVKNKKGN